MTSFSAAARARLSWILVPTAVLLTLALGIGGCSLLKSDDTTADDEAAQGDTGEPLPPPVANIAVSYKRPGDALARATVTKFFGAEVIETKARDAAHAESVVRFDGGVPIWEFKATESGIGSLTGIGARKYALKSIDYGKVPQNFAQVLPEEGPPEPLDRGSYYVFEIERGSGSTSYQAVKVAADGSLQAYNAQPRAGSSYLLCCNVSSEFPEPVVLPDTSPEQTAEPAPDQPPDQSPDQSPTGGPAPGSGLP